MPSTETILNSFSYFFLDTLIVTTVDRAVWKRLGKLPSEQSGLPELRPKLNGIFQAREFIEPITER